MNKPYMTPVSRALPDIKIPEPRLSKLVIALIKILGRLYLFLFFGVARVFLRGEKALFDAFKRSLEGKSRCIIAFRHPNGGEPQLLTWFFLFKLRALAARSGVRFPRRPHAVFVYGYEVIRWGGWVARFVMPRLGAMPVHHSKVDSSGMTRIYKAIVDGPFPLALAPEGQVSYTSDSIPRLEQGAIRIGFAVADRMSRAEKPAPVEILPVSVHFRFGSWGKFTLKLLLGKIEKATGSGRRGKTAVPFTKRLQVCRDHILEVNEKRYCIKPDPARSFEERMDAVIAAALDAAEKILGIRSSGDLFARIYSLRQRCWDRIILPGVDTLDNFSEIERGITDLAAGEAWYAGRHLEIADFSWYFRVPLPADDAPLHRKIEYTQNLWDFANRTMGGAYANRISIFPRRVIIQAAPLINLTERLPAYHKDKKSAINSAMADLRQAYMDCIDKIS